MREVFAIFLRLGLTSFGGPVAHLAYFRSEFVERRRWLDEQCPLQDLRRQRVGSMSLAPLELGQWRQLQSHERF